MAERRQQIEDLFHAALARKPQERASFLSEACSSDPSLRAEVESLISAHEEPGSFLDSPAYERTADLIDGAEAYSLIGSSIGHYDVLDLIGRGGMGDVYLARDQLLDRKVALKLLPLQFTADQIRLHRFVQEAKAASSLNHPNIITIHQIGHAGSVHFIATEFVAGRTLRKRLAGNAISAGDALDVAIQVASALAASHAAGIVHRDIKPENVMIRPDGYVKVLDFGLAKLTEKPIALKASDMAGPPGFDTDPGTVMGTIRYMSPEQARGLEVDGRSDIFNVGILLYEMLTGRLPFDGDTTGDVIKAILDSEPAKIAEFAPDTTPDLIHVVAKALSKDRDARYQTSEEMLSELKSIKQNLERDRSSPQPSIPIEPPAPSRSYAGWLAATLLVAGIVIALLWVRAKNESKTVPGSEDPAHATKLFEWRNSPGESLSYPKFSPDGSLIAYSAIKGDQNEAIWTVHVTGDSPHRVTNDSESNSNPVWSPDGQQIVFVSLRGDFPNLVTIDIDGGTTRLLKAFESKRPIPALTQWSRDGTRIFYEFKGNLFALDLASTRIEQITSFDPVIDDPKNFSLSPDESQIAYRAKNEGQSDIWVEPLSGGAPIQITNDAAIDRNPLWMPDGKRIVYGSSRGDDNQICIAFLDARPPVQLTRGEGSYLLADLSGDGTRILYTNFRDESTIAGVPATGGEEADLTANLDVSIWPEVSPDGRFLAFQASHTSDGEVVQKAILLSKPLTGDEPAKPLVSDAYDVHWLPDGGRISFLRVANSIGNIWIADSSGGNERQITTSGVAVTGHAKMPVSRLQTGGHSWSKDGNQVAYCSTRLGFSNVWTASLDSAVETNVTNNTDIDLSFVWPLWAPNGSTLAVGSLLRNPADPNRRWSIWVAEGERAIQSVFTSANYVRLVGWTAAGDSVLVAVAEDTTVFKAQPATVELLSVSVQSGRRQKIAQLESTYPSSVQLSPDRGTILFTSRRDGGDNIWLLALAGGQPVRVTGNRQNSLYYSSPSWSPDGRTIYYARQQRWSRVWMIDNFK